MVLKNRLYLKLKLGQKNIIEKKSGAIAFKNIK